MLPTVISPGLWRWTTRHPDWRPGAEPGSPGDWDPVVGSALYETDGHAAFFDPLVTEPALWRWVDQRCHGRRVLSLTTIRWHRRSSDQLVQRFQAATSRARGNLPHGVQPIAIPGGCSSRTVSPCSPALEVLLS